MTTLMFDCADWLAEYPNGELSATVLLPSTSDPAPLTAVIEGTVLSIPVTQALTAKPGNGSIVVVMRVGDEIVKKSDTITTYVQPSHPAPVGIIPTPVQDWIDSAEQKLALVAGVATSEQERLNAEAARVTAETARATAETGRADAEQERAEAENTRTTAEQGRTTAENARVSAEGRRVTAEQGRVTTFTTMSGQMATATQAAGQAATQAGQAADAANDAAGAATTAAQGANTAKQAAETATTAADAAKDAANTAAGKADTAALEAETQAEAAETAAEQANTAAQAAGAAATSATAAAGMAEKGHLWKKAEGNPASVYPVPESNIYAKVSGAPTQEGTGDPSPDNVRPIKPWVAKDAQVKVRRTGKNLVQTQPKMTAYSESLTIEFSQDVSFPKGVVLSFEAVNFAFAENSAAFVNFKKADGTNFYRIGTLFKTASGVSLTANTIYNGKIVLIVAPVTFQRLIFYSMTSSYSRMSGEIRNVQLEEGPTATPYEPYTADEVTLVAPEDIGGGWIDNEGAGAGEWGVKAFDGTENWQIYSTGLSQYTTFTTTSCFWIEIPTAMFGFGSSFCTHFRNLGNNRAYVVDTNSGLLSDHSISARKYFSWGNVGETVENFKAWLAAQHAAGTPVTIAYKLANPVALSLPPVPIVSLPQLSRTEARQNVVTADKGDLAITYAKSPIREAEDSAPLASYPIGSIYRAATNTSPALLFGGSWSAISAPAGEFAWKRTV